jgi:hypothetical protein
MLIQNDNKPLVTLAILVMVLCGILGVFLGMDPFGPGQAVRAESERANLALSIQATQASMSATQTPQAIYANQTAVAAELTAIPFNQTATAVAFNGQIGSAQISATQTALANAGMAQQMAYQATQESISQQQALNAMAYNATATAFVQGPITKANHDNTVLFMFVIGVVAISIWLVTHAMLRASRERVEEQKANAQMFAEQRRLLSVRASIRAHQNQPHTGTSQSQRNYADLSKHETGQRSR